MDVVLVVSPVSSVHVKNLDVNPRLVNFFPFFVLKNGNLIFSFRNALLKTRVYYRKKGEKKEKKIHFRNVNESIRVRCCIEELSKRLV